MTILNEIAEYTKQRYIEQEKVVPFEEIKGKAEKMDNNTGFPFEKALAKEGLSYICEVKKASPSKRHYCRGTSLTKRLPKTMKKLEHQQFLA